MEYSKEDLMEDTSADGKARHHFGCHTGLCQSYR